MPTFGTETTAVWDSEDVVWGFYGPPAPSSPTALVGTSAPEMLAYLPDYYDANEEVRGIIQAEGYEMDILRHVGENDTPTLLRPDAAPTWALEAWEQMLGLGNARWSWTDAERAAALNAQLANVVSVSDIKAWVSAVSGVDEADIEEDIDHANYGFEWEIRTEITSDQAARISWALLRVAPAHATVEWIHYPAYPTLTPTTTYTLRTT